jgi:hypothetical protein
MFCVVDIDSTLYAFEQVLHDLALEMYGVELTIEPPFWGSWDREMGSYQQLTEVFARVHSPEQIVSNVPYPGAVESLQALHADGMRFRYVSDRDGAALAATEQWLKAMGFPQAEQLSCTHDKRQWLHNHRNQISTIIDDRLLTITHARFQMHIPHVFSLRHGWNANLSDMPGVHLADTWPELESFIRAHHLVR